MKELRLDRFLTINFFHPLAKRIKASECRIPILMYHSISDEPERVHPYFRINTAPAVFESHMKYLHDSGHSVIDLMDLDDYFKTDPAVRAVILTFDDGYRDFCLQAYPILEKYGFKSTVFLSSGFIGRSFLNKKECLKWSEVRELGRNGVTFGAHTVSHPALLGLPEKEMEKEITDSKAEIEDETGRNVNAFSYPGKLPENTLFLERLREILTRSNFKAGVSTRIGTSDENDDRIFLKRLPVNSEDDLDLFRAKLESGYDWLNLAQLIYKKARRSN